MVLTANLVGAEVGDQNHSRAFPPRVVDAGYDVLKEMMEEYFNSSPFIFPLPLAVVTDKDESKLR